MQDGAIEELRQRSRVADDMIANLRRQITEVSRVALAKMFNEESASLRRENELLEAEVAALKARLVEIESRNGVKQISIPINSEIIAPKTESQPPSIVSLSPPSIVISTAKEAETPEDKQQQAPAKREGTEQQKKKKPKASAAVEDKLESEPDVGQLDLRVGLIVRASKHPDADSLYVEEIDLGEERPRTVVSGLVRFVPLDQMQNRLAVLLCNLKPAKMRGVLSEAMVMCASTPDKVELLDPPQGSVPGDRVVCEEYPGEPEKQLNPKKKIWEQIAPHLKTDEQRVATYKGATLSVKGKGLVIAPSLKCVQIK